MHKLGIMNIKIRLDYSCADFDIDTDTGVEVITNLTKWVYFNDYDPTFDYVAAVLSNVKMIRDKVVEFHYGRQEAFDIYSLGIFLNIEAYSGYELERELLYDELGYIDSVLNVYNKIIVDFDKKWYDIED